MTETQLQPLPLSSPYDGLFVQLYCSTDLGAYNNLISLLKYFFFSRIIYHLSATKEKKIWKENWLNTYIE